MSIQRAPGFVSLLAAALAAFLVGGDADAGERGLHLSAGVMALTNSTRQGGSGPEGSTILTQTDLVYHWAWFGLGAYLQYDRQGSSETDLGFGPKLELHGGPFYAQAGYSALMRRAFTDRSIARQTGDGWVFGAGTRFMLGSGSSGRGSSGATGLFFQFTYVYRIQNVRKQDGVTLGEPIVQKDGYPLFGVGLIF